MTSLKADLAGVLELFSAVKAMRGETLSIEDDARMSAAFESHCKTVSTRLAERLQTIDSAQKKTEILMAKHGLYDVCFQEVINFTESLQADDLAQVLRKIRAVHTTLFQSVPGIVENAGSVEEKKWESKMNLMKIKLTQTDQETNQLLEAAEMLESESKTKEREIKNLRSIIERLEKTNEELKKNASLVSVLETDNFQKQKSSSDRNGGGREGKHGRGRAAKAHVIKTKASSSPVMGATPLPLPRSPLSPSSPSLSPSPPSPSPTKTTTTTVAKSTCSTIRNLTQKQLLQFMSDLYASKTKYDKKCVKSRLPRETMEQHLYTFLNQRYGLRKLIIENATAVIKATNKYCAVSNEVAVFKNIINNVIDEEFRFVQKQLVMTISELLRVHLKAKLPLKGDEVVTKLATKIEKTNICESEWKEIVKYMYDEQDVTTLTIILHREARKFSSELNAKRNELRRSSGVPRNQLNDEYNDGDKNDNERDVDENGNTFNATGKIKFSVFQKCLQDFQLLGHERFLKTFRAIFEQQDHDRNGILNEAEFRKIVVHMKPTVKETEIVRLLEIADPYNNDSITFSDSVGCLSELIVSHAAQEGAKRREQEKFSNKKKKERDENDFFATIVRKSQK